MYSLLLLTTIAVHVWVLATPTAKRTAEAFFPPIDGGGSELDVAASPLGEPLNV